MLRGVRSGFFAPDCEILVPVRPRGVRRFDLPYATAHFRNYVSDNVSDNVSGYEDTQFQDKKAHSKTRGLRYFAAVASPSRTR